MKREEHGMPAGYPSAIPQITPEQRALAEHRSAAWCATRIQSRINDRQPWWRAHDLFTGVPYASALYFKELVEAGLMDEVRPKDKPPYYKPNGLTWPWTSTALAIYSERNQTTDKPKEST